MKSFYLMMILSLIFINTANAHNHSYYIDDEKRLPDYLLNEGQGQIFETKMPPCVMKNYEKFRKQDKPMASAIEWRNYNVLEYDLYLDWYNPLASNSSTITPEERAWTGSNKITILIDSNNVSKVEFDAKGLNILSVDVNSESSKTFSQPDDEQVMTVEFNEVFYAGDTVVITINYEYNYKDNYGFYLYPKGAFSEMGPWHFDADSNYIQDPVLVLERIAYTQSEPDMARAWMPCNDYPHDKAMTYITVKVPTGYTPVSNGLLMDKIEDDSSETFYWHHSSPMTTYLMAVSASIYTNYTEYYHLQDNPDDSIPVTYYMWQADYNNESTDGLQPNARYAYREHLQMMDIFATAFNEYPYESYGLVSVEPYQFGGMEHQTMTTIHRRYTRKLHQLGYSHDYTCRMVQAHELSHQWIGDLVTCATWKDLWINEGGATFSEAFWSGAISDWGYESELKGDRSHYIRKSEGGVLPPIYDLPINTLFGTYSVLVYSKAGLFYNMLYTMLGEEEFLATFRALLDEYKYQSIETDQFRDFFVEHHPDAPVDLTLFFDQWLKHPGHPIYDLNVVTALHNGGNNAEVTVEFNQVQEGENVPELFKVPLTVYFLKGDSIAYSEKIVNDEIGQHVTFYMDFAPDSIKLDTISTLCQMKSQSVITGIEEDINADFNMKIFPNPAKDMFKLEINHNSPGEAVTVEIYSLLGNKVYQEHLNLFSAGTELKTVTLPKGLPAGAYKVMLSTQTESMSATLIVEK